MPKTFKNAFTDGYHLLEKRYPNDKEYMEGYMAGSKARYQCMSDGACHMALHKSEKRAASRQTALLHMSLAIGLVLLAVLTVFLIFTYR